jgi:hypothetical protein
MCDECGIEEFFYSIKETQIMAKEWQVRNNEKKPIDNNVSEREMKRVVLNCKNSLFVGNPREGRTAAIVASLTSSCRRHEMDPQLYFMQLLVNLSSWPANDLDAWLPDRWKQAHAARCAALEIPPLDS